MTAALDSTVSISCSDVTENTYVLILEWRCEGACSSTTNSNNNKNNNKVGPTMKSKYFSRSHDTVP